MKKSLKVLVILAASIATTPAFAGKAWSPQLSNWELHLDNGVAYVTATNMPSYCSYSRAQIETSLSSYQRDIYSYVLAASQTGKSLKIVTETAETVCKVYGANAY